ncbi:MAG: hypothetical protein HC915_03860 [Anaerolineae bacterium]|nr:hypothetical protein [Anaerolineae bacterium]
MLQRSMSDIKHFSPIDLPLFRRLAAQGVSLDTVAQIRDASPLETAMLGSVAWMGRGRPTFILRGEEGILAAQMVVEETRARITLVAPAPQPRQAVSAWLMLIDHLAEQAGRRGGAPH